MTRQDKMKINNLLVRMKQMEDEIERFKLFDNQIEAEYNRVFDGCVTNRTMLDEQCRKIGDLKAENEQLKEKLNARLTCDFVKTAQKQAKIEAVKEFAEKVKEEVYPFLQAEMYNKKHFITGDLISDKLLENQNIGILKAQDVLSKWFKVKIDELLKEYEK